MSLPAIAGLNDSNYFVDASSWGIVGATIENHQLGSGLADDAVGTILNSSGTGQIQSEAGNPNVTVPVGDYYITTNTNSYASNDPQLYNRGLGVIANFTLEGSIVIGGNTEYIWKAVASSPDSNGFIVTAHDASPNYMRFWNGDPALPNNTAPGVTINSMNLRG
jgi:hypothetical protein